LYFVITAVISPIRTKGQKSYK